ncbi:MAG: I78 family peptidase inhibitor [Thermomonas sp.]
MHAPARGLDPCRRTLHPHHRRGFPHAAAPVRTPPGPAADRLRQPTGAASAANAEAARQAAGARTVRSLKPGQPMTMDYRGDRLNVLQDAAGKIDKISCG